MDFNKFIEYIVSKNFTKLAIEDLTIGYLKSVVYFPLFLALFLLTVYRKIPYILLSYFLLALAIIEFIFSLFPRLNEFRINRLNSVKRKCIDCNED